MTIPDTTLLFNIDSIFMARPEADTMYRPSVFVRHQLQTGGIEFAERAAASPSFVVLAVVVGLLIMMHIYLHSRHINIASLIAATVSNHQFSLLQRESSFDRLLSFLEVEFFFSVMAAMSILLFLVSPVSSLEGAFKVSQPLQQLAFMSSLFLGVFLLLILRMAVINFLGNTFRSSSAVSLYMSNSHVYLMLDALLLLPVVLMEQYAPFASRIMWLPMAIVAVLFVFRIVRGMVYILTNGNNSRMYLFYYLCIVEFVPVLVLAKLILSL